MGKRNSILLVVVIAVAVLFAIWMTQQTAAPTEEPEEPTPTVSVANFQECVDAGNPIMESYPRQCRSGNETFTEDIGNELDHADLIRLDSPRPNQVVGSPLVITGEARGTWFFEASFPVSLVNWDGLIIAEGIATATDDWMTEEFVPFTAELLFEADPNVYSNRGALILQKDNPSGLPEYDDALEVPVLIGDAKPVGGGAGILPFDSGVRGAVLRGPICPVQKDPPDPDCADQPFATTVQAIEKYGTSGAPFATVETDKDGRFEIALPPGEFGLQPVGGRPFPTCMTQDVTVEPGVMLEVDLTCDTGIR